MNDAIIFVGAGIALLSLLGALSLLVVVITYQKKVKDIENNDRGNRQQRKRRRKKVSQLKNRQRLHRKRSLLLLVLSGLVAGGIGYLNYYQAMNLSQKDGNQVAKSYYLVRDFEEELIKARGLKEPDKGTQESLRQVAIRLASYGIEKADSRNAKEGQLLLNRYYGSVTELGKNGSQQMTKLFGDSEILSSLLLDVEKIQNYEKEVFAYYRVDEDKLKQEK